MRPFRAFSCASVVIVAGTLALAAEDKGQGQTPGPEVIPILVQIVKDKTEDDGLRNAAAQGLIVIGRKSVPALIELLEAKDHALRLCAAAILTNMRPGQARDAIPVLLRVIKDPQEDKDLRRQAALALSQALASAP